MLCECTQYKEHLQRQTHTLMGIQIVEKLFISCPIIELAMPKSNVQGLREDVF